MTARRFSRHGHGPNVRPSRVGALAATVLWLSACGGGGEEKPAPPPDPQRTTTEPAPTPSPDPQRPATEPAPAPSPDAQRIVTEQVGRGAQSAFIVRQAGERPRPVVLFLHGWGATLPRSYRPWLEHLARAGNVVVYPRYQDSVLSDPAQVLANLLAGVRLALPRAAARPDSLVVVGHSAGGALSADYAAVARRAGLPVPRAILALYPGRTLRGIAAGIPEIPPDRIPSGTRIVALAGAQDRVVGTAPARRIAASATRVPRARRTYELIRDPAVADHLGPQRSEAATRRVFWRRLDSLLHVARR